MLHGNIYAMLFTRDCQRGEMLHGNICSFMRDCQRWKCCTVTYVAVHEGLPERGNVAR